MKKTIYFVFLCLAISQCVYSLDVDFANIRMIDEGNTQGKGAALVSMEEMLIKAIQDQDRADFLQMHMVKKEIRSTLDAARWLAGRDTTLLLYGELNQTSAASTILSISLYDKEAQSNQQMFYVTGQRTEIQLMVEQMAQEIVAYFYQAFSVKSAAVQDSWMMSVLAGEIFPLSHSQSFLGILSGAYELRYQLDPILGGAASLEESVPDSVILRPHVLGFASYGLALNQPEYQKVIDHKIQLGFGVGLGFQVGPHLLLGGLRYISVLSLYHRQPLHDEPRISILHFYGVGLNIGYEYWSKNHRVGFGVHHHLNLAFFRASSYILDYRLLLSVTILIPSASSKPFLEVL
jgi:hypothetical protein